MNYEQLKGIPVSEYEYPGEANALAALKKIPMLDEITAAFLKYINQVGALPAVLGDCFRITERTAPDIYRVYKRVLTRLDMPEEYPLFAKPSFDYNAYTTGGSAPYVVVHSAALKMCDEETLMALLGHEVGHIKSKHLIYSMMGQYLNQLLSVIKLPGINLTQIGLNYALLHWVRMHEYTADRAGALAAGSVETAKREMVICMGIERNLDFVNITDEDILAQNAAFEEGKKGILGQALSISMIMEATHPWSVNRVQALEAWKNSGEFDALIAKYGR